MKILALAAGLSFTDVEKLLGGQVVNMEQLFKVRAVNDEIKALKVILNPTIQVYQSEFGIIPALKHQVDTKTGILSCKTLMYSGDCSSEDCASQSCRVHECGVHNCSSFNCGQHSSREMACERFTPNILSMQTLERFKNDPFIQECFKAFNVKTTSDLVMKLKTLIK
jgi:hypothetical protein